MKRLYFNILIFCFFLFAVPGSFAKTRSQTTSILENGTGSIHIMTLENGFTLFVKEDTNSALIHSQFLCKAGISRQNPENSGFFTLFQRLFAKKIEAEGECKADSCDYAKDFTSGELDSYLKMLAEKCMNPVFSDEEIKSQYAILKEEVEKYASTTTAFINSAIDSRVFYSQPWKQDTGIYPAIFTNYTESEARTFLNDIAQRYYNPCNSALFITGNLKSENVYKLVKKYFGNWENKNKNIENQDGDIKLEGDEKEIKKFVLTDPSFSPQLTQIVVQYTGLSMAQADILSAAFNSVNSKYKKIQLENPVVAIRSKDYLAAASAQKSNSSRLILQALMEEPFSFSENKNIKVKISPAQQATQFCQGLENAAELSDKDFEEAANSIEAKYREQTGNPIQGMNLLSSWWALDSSFSSEGFYKKFLTAAHAGENIDREELKRAFKNEKPYVFLLVNSQVYEKNKKSFDEGAWSLITAKNASWYSNQIAVKKAFEAKEKKEEELEEIMTPGVIQENLNQAEYFYYKNLPLLKTGSLENGIPLALKISERSQTVSLCISIKGGEVSSPEGEHLLRSVMINYFARNIQNEIVNKKAQGLFTGLPKASAYTGNLFSTIYIDCLSSDLEQTMMCITDAIIFGDIKPVMADSLAHEMQAQWASKIIGLSNQLEFNAFKYLYKGSEFERLYDTQVSPLEKTTISSITQAYTALLDASLYSLTAAGDISYEEFFKAAQSSFGLLHEQQPRKNISIPQPVFKNKNRRVQLRHLYATDKTPEMAPNGVPILVPTKDFYDPAHFYFKSPAMDNNQGALPLYNALLTKLESNIQAQLGDQANCKAHYADLLLPVSSLKVDALLHTKIFLKAYKKAREEILAGLTDENTENQDKISREIKNLWIKETLSATQTNAGTASLIEKGMQTGQPELYLKDYIKVENANPEDFYEIMKKYFTEDPEFTVYSVDSKK